MSKMESISQTYAHEPIQFLEKLQALPGQLLWNYFSTGLSYSAFVNYDNQLWSLTDNPNTPEIETSAFIIVRIQVRGLTKTEKV
ncbi:MAG UNVERIFIED_CONTAM: hypothetical protein LVR29_06030 [Microcystis novacekii LVE1205-3]|jgi:hypothetical protein